MPAVTQPPAVPKRMAPRERRRAFVIVGLGFGDEGKGSVVDALTRRHQAELVVRFNGGAQAAHYVVDDDGRVHCFRMFGSGTLAGARTYLSEYVLVNPLVLAVEAAQLVKLDPALGGALRMMSVHRAAPLTTPFHVALNRLRELAAGRGRHGSCGLGIAETMRDVVAGRALRFGDIGHPDFPARFAELQARKRREAEELLRGAALDAEASDRAARELSVLSDPRELDDALWTFETVAAAVETVDALPAAQTTIFEGAQGVLLDEHWGFTPHKTYSTTTSANALRILNGRNVDVSVLGLTRGFATRHGHGPLPTQEPSRHEAAAFLVGEHNARNAWQEDFRVGYPDAVALRYAAQADGHLDGLIVTCLDRIPKAGIDLAVGYEAAELDGRPGSLEADLARTRALFSASPRYERVSVDDLPGRLAAAAGVPVVALSHGPQARDKIWLREPGGNARALQMTSLPVPVNS